MKRALCAAAIVVAAACRGPDVVSAPRAVGSPSFGVASDPGLVGVHSLDYNAGTGFLVVICDVEQGIFEAAAHNKLGLTLNLRVAIANKQGQSRTLTPRDVRLQDVKSFEIVPGPHMVTFPVNIPWGGLDGDGVPMSGDATAMTTVALISFPDDSRRELSRPSSRDIGFALPRYYMGTQRGGGLWTWWIGPSAFGATDQATGYTYSGTKTVLPTGFLKLVVSSSTDPIIGTGARAYALEYPSAALFVQPWGARGYIAAAALGPCLSATETFNWITVPPIAAVVYEFNGTFTLTPTGAATDYTVSGERNLTDETTQPISGTASCRGGAVGTSLGDVGAVAQSKAMALDHSKVDGAGRFGVTLPATNVDLTTVDSRSYRGFLFRLLPTGDVIRPVAVEPLDVDLRLSCYVNVETGDRCSTSEDFRVSLSDAIQTAPGVIRFTMIRPTALEFAEVLAAVNFVGSKLVLYGIVSDATFPIQGSTIVLIEP
jgi:hypothetical protein